MCIFIVCCSVAIAVAKQLVGVSFCVLFCCVANQTITIRPHRPRIPRRSIFVPGALNPVP